MCNNPCFKGFCILFFEELFNNKKSIVLILRMQSHFFGVFDRNGVCFYLDKHRRNY
jgi:hypothetical protein